METNYETLNLNSLFDDGLSDYEEPMDANASVSSAVVPSILPENHTMADAEQHDTDLTTPQNNPTIKPVEANPISTLTSVNLVSPSSELNTFVVPNVNRKGLKCPICGKNHPLRFCYKFRDMSLERKLRMVAIHRICSRCLAYSHGSNECKSVAFCKFCKNKHHSLLHEQNNRSRIRSKPKTKTCKVPIRQAVAFSPTLRLKLFFNGKKVPLRAVLDSCSQNSYICAELVRKLGVDTFEVDGSKYCRIVVESIFDSTKKMSITARVHVMNRIKTPPESVPDVILHYFEGLQLADPSFNQAGNVALVLGSEVMPLVMTGRVHTNPGLPLAQYTMFGWVISGLSPI